MHPGELLREEILPALDRSKTEIAKLLGVSRQTLYDILAEKQPVTPAMALRLGKRSRSLAQSAEAVRSAPRAAGTRRDDQQNSDAASRLKESRLKARTCWPGRLICPDGRSGQFRVQCARQKYFAWRFGRNRFIDSAIPSHTEGRFAIVTDVGRSTS
jgi:addiction module HigA family antidote